MSDAAAPADQRADAPPVPVGDLRVAVDLDATVEGESLRVRTADGRVELFADGFAAVRHAGALRDALPDGVGGTLDDVPLGVHVAGVEVARADPGVPAGPVSRALGAAPLRIDVGGVVRALVRRRG
ncbi:hypothetical protein [Halobaculum lipolyticum]|uniref:Peptide ABC transporter ATP-binding protein n=1 Tax=Halobaculum lipolyticum TaxID=3032001 RepID=A0ABD5WCC1_9EURY|nr:hypothetical protein [Halobaculum sp. DT31]